MSGAISVVHMHAPVSQLSRPTLWGMRNATAVFAVSEFVRVSLIDIGITADKIYTIHNAVDADHFDPDKTLPSSPSIRGQFGIPAGARIAGIAARMNPWKGQYELIGAVSRIKDAFPDLHVMILGANVPAMREEYEKRARAGRHRGSCSLRRIPAGRSAVSSRVRSVRASLLSRALRLVDRRGHGDAKAGDSLQHRRGPRNHHSRPRWMARRGAL